MNSKLDALQKVLDRIKTPKKWFSPSRISFLDIDNEALVESLLVNINGLTDKQISERIIMTLRGNEGAYGNDYTFVIC
jgi:hypothetical protein